MSFINNNNEEIKFLDMNGNEIVIGTHIYPPEGGQELRVMWFIPNRPDFGDVLWCQQVHHIDTFSPLSVEQCAKQWKIVNYD